MASHDDGPHIGVTGKPDGPTAAGTLRTPVDDATTRLVSVLATGLTTLLDDAMVGNTFIDATAAASANGDNDSASTSQSTTSSSIDDELDDTDVVRPRNADNDERMDELDGELTDEPCDDGDHTDDDGDDGTGDDTSSS